MLEQPTCRAILILLSLITASCNVSPVAPTDDLLTGSSNGKPPLSAEARGALQTEDGERVAAIAEVMTRVPFPPASGLSGEERRRLALIKRMVPTSTPTPTPVPGQFLLTFSLDASFQEPHGGQPIRIALVQSSDEALLAQKSGTVSATENPSFTFAAGRLLQQGMAYEVHYWIDSNIDGGTIGACDPKAVDHQWSFEILSATNDVNFTTAYNPALTEDVCGTFT